MAETIKTLEELEELFQEQADINGPCPLPDPKTDGTRSIEHIVLIHVEPQPPDYNYDKLDNEAESKGFAKSMWRKFGNGELVNDDGTPMTKEQLKKLLRALEN